MDFEKFEYNIKFFKYHDSCNFDEFNLHYYFEFEWIDLQSSNTWTKKFINVRQLIKEIENNSL